MSRYLRNTLCILLVIMFLPFTKAFSTEESYIQTLSGKIKKGDSCTVVDEKFQTLSLAEWNQLQNTYVQNILTFELRKDTNVYYQSRSFSCTLDVSLKYYSSKDQQNPTEINNIKLVVKYDTATGAVFPMSAVYKFKNAYKVIAIVNSISSPEWGNKLPNVFRIKNQLIIKRTYPVSPDAKPAMRMDAVTKLNKAPLIQETLNAYNGNAATADHLDDQPAPAPQVFPNTLPIPSFVISWNPDQNENSNGGQAYEVEWTFIDAASENGQTIHNQYGVAEPKYSSGGGSVNVNIPTTTLAQWMRYDNTRVTVPWNAPGYAVDMPYSDGYIVGRVRLIAYSDVEKKEIGTIYDWSYNNKNNSQPFVIIIPPRQENLNFQFTSSFAEDAKRKSVVSYFDATLRNRQTVTINNSDNVAVIGETIYDNMGRPAVNILPAPSTDLTLNYHPNFNRNSSGMPYNHTNIHSTGTTDCAVDVEPLSPSSGTAMYYSPANPFPNTGDFAFMKYVPNADNKPFAATQYTPDNTGRISRQGGVGPAFQIQSTRETKYFYGKPLQFELDRLFGMEVGDASHYLKNMVIDPNGQASVSYIDANGKTIATALAGESDPSSPLDKLPSQVAGKRSFTENIVRAEDMVSNATALKTEYATTFLATTKGDYTFSYSVSPAALKETQAKSNFCTNCYYELVLRVTDKCGLDKIPNPIPVGVFAGRDISCSNTTVYTGTKTISNLDVGEYNITYSLQLSKDEMQYQENYYINENNNQDLKKLQAFFNEQLAAADLSGCYSDCYTCEEKLGNEAAFTQQMKDLLVAQKAEKYAGYTFDENDPGILSTIHDLYKKLHDDCVAAKASCEPLSPCMQKLELMKKDVLPGGQYAQYTTDPLTDTYTYIERNINVLQYYQTFTDVYYTDENGATIYIKDLSESDFIKAYKNHPEWAGSFVTKHIEYCSYLFCASSQNVTDAFSFEEKLRDRIIKSDDAVAKGYFDLTKSTTYPILDVDPFFYTYTTYKASMKSDLDNLSKVLKMTGTNTAGSMYDKNIYQLIDWMLYFKVDGQSTSYQSSWNAANYASLSTDCRAYNKEWELFKTYYLQLRSKYVYMAKIAMYPCAVNCFIGSTDAGSCQQATGNPIVAPCPSLSDFVLEKGPEQASAPYDLPPDFPNNNTQRLVTIRHVGGVLTRPVTITLRVTHYYETNYAQPSWEGSTSYCQNLRTISSYVYNWPITIPAGTDRSLQTEYSRYSSAQNKCPENSGGGISLMQVQPPSGDYPYDFYRDTYDLVGGSVYCEEYTPPLPSSCTLDPRYNDYKNKKRIFDDYTNLESATACMTAGVTPVTSQTEADAAMIANLQSAKNNATDKLMETKSVWSTLLRTVRDGETAFSAITDNDITTLTDRLYIVAKDNIDWATDINSIRPASTLPAPPAGKSYTGYQSFEAAFQSIPTIAGLMSKGFNQYLLADPYPYDKNPVMVSPNVTDLSNPNICSALADFDAQRAIAGEPSLYKYLKNVLGDDFVITEANLTELQSRCAVSCPNVTTKPLNNDMILPVAFTLPAAERGKGCSTITTAIAAFKAAYPTVIEGSKLYNNLLPTYLNHLYGYSLSATEYAQFAQTCGTNANAMLYNKSGAQSYPEDPFACAATIIARIFNTAGQAYDDYIAVERVKFRNSYVSKCLGTSTTVQLSGVTSEYHYTLYYYDQAGNLVKTIPPEGVQPLSDADTKLIPDARKNDVNNCTYSGGASTDKNSVLTTVSSSLAANTGRAIEMWLYSTAASGRQVRFKTPDNKYMYQAAINDKKLWVEIYTLEPGIGDISITASNQVYADLSALPSIQAWSHLVVQSAANLTTGDDLQLYLDGHALTVQHTGPTMPPYPFAWEVEAGVSSFTLPAEDLAILKHLRIYNRAVSDIEVLANYHNGCMNPQGALNGSPLLAWGRFNVPAPGSETTVGNTTNEYARIFITPDHMMATSYQYNSLNQVVTQTSPDAGISKFWYDKLGRLVVSQNAQQQPGGKFSYTIYDGQGRISEVGETVGNSTPTANFSGTDIESWLSGTAQSQVTITAYDASPDWVPAGVLNNQFNLRKRVAATAAVSSGRLGNANRTAASYYSYDILGNVDLLVQENAQLIAASASIRPGNDDGLKRLEYQYDLVSGKVNKVIYQRNKGDQFAYLYEYDADNRLTDAYSNVDPSNNTTSGTWQKDAKYSYYLHGPLARVELGKDRVQGLDYAYTLQGWLKGVNSTVPNSTFDMGKDGGSPDANAMNKDAFGYALHYFNNDYAPVNAANPFASASGIKELYNGNIAAMSVNIAVPNWEALQYRYNYDQLNRIKQMNAFNGLNAANNTWNPTALANDMYKESISYDANGNILSYNRNGNQAQAMDILSYKHNRDNNNRLQNNKLQYVQDDANDGVYTTDIKNQAPGYYNYDAIGNLVKDGNNIIDWTVYGKIKTVSNTPSGTIQYEYDAAGNRISKAVSGSSATTYYVRDAQGNVMAVYSLKNSNFTWDEQHLYGSSRLGMWQPGITPNSTTNADATWQLSGKKYYELSNHLGNVLATITDKKIAHSSDGSTIDYYNADIVSATDYYPFGMQMVGRSFNAGGYKYGFNGKENDNDVKGEGNQQDYGMRIYDTRLGKFLSVDPLTRDYPWNSNYAFAENDVMRSIDLDGLERYVITNWRDASGFITKTQISTFTEKKSKKLVDLNLLIANQKVTVKDVLIRNVDSRGNISLQTRSNLLDREITVLKHGVLSIVPTKSPEQGVVYYNDKDHSKDLTTAKVDYPADEYELSDRSLSYRRPPPVRLTTLNYSSQNGIMGYLGTKDIVGNNTKNGTLDLYYGKPETQIINLPGQIKADGGIREIHINIVYGMDPNGVDREDLEKVKKGVHNLAEQLRRHFLKSGVSNKNIYISENVFEGATSGNGTFISLRR